MKKYYLLSTLFLLLFTVTSVLFTPIANGATGLSGTITLTSLTSSSSTSSSSTRNSSYDVQIKITSTKPSTVYLTAFNKAGCSFNPSIVTTQSDATGKVQGTVTIRSSCTPNKLKQARINIKDQNGKTVAKGTCNVKGGKLVATIKPA